MNEGKAERADHPTEGRLQRIETDLHEVKADIRQLSESMRELAEATTNIRHLEAGQSDNARQIRNHDERLRQLENNQIRQAVALTFGQAIAWGLALLLGGAMASILAAPYM